jgi:hypothetical protein
MAIYGITRSPDTTMAILQSGKVTLLGEAYAPSKRAVDTRIVVNCNKQLVGSVRLKGYVSFTSSGKANAVGLSDDDIELVRASPFYMKAKFVWVLDLPQRYQRPFEHPGGLGLWKMAKTYEGDVQALEASLELPSPPPVEESAFDPAEGVDLAAQEILEERGLMETTEEQTLIPWKRKVFFPGDVCGVKDCSRPAEGYMTSTRKKKLWWGPICRDCSIGYTTHEPYSLASVAQQRKGLEDLAAALDSPVDNVAGLLEEHGLDEFGKPLHRPQNGVNGVARPAPADIVPPDDPALERATAVAVIPKQELAEVQAELVALRPRLDSFLIVDQAGMDLAANLTKMIKARWEALEARRKEAARPLDDAKKTVQAAFKPVLTELAELEQLLKQRMLEGQHRMNALQDAALAQAQQAYQQGDLNRAALATQHAQASGVDLSSGVSVRQILDFEVVDLNLVPREFFVLDGARVLHALRAGLEVPGIRRVLRESVAVRS